MRTAQCVQHYHSLCQQLALLEKKYPAREPLILLVASKYATVEEILALYQAGQRAFAENYWQAAQKKMQALKDLEIVWHFIGHLQSNKCAEIATHFSWVHSVAKLKHIALLAKARKFSPPLQICLQVNFNENVDKYGASPKNLSAFIHEVLQYPQLRLRGLMVLPLPGMTEDFLKLAELRDRLEQNFSIALPTLSMGMSQDYPAAIQAGATIVRIGSLLFK